MGLKIYISHADIDKHDADIISYRLAGDGYSTHIDNDDIDALTSHTSETVSIKNSIHDSDIVIFLLSPEALEKNSYVLTEMRHAKEKWQVAKGHVIPVILRDVPDNIIPPYVAAFGLVKPAGDLYASILTAVQKMEEMQKNEVEHTETTSISLPKGKNIIGPVIASIMTLALYVGYMNFGAGWNIFTDSSTYQSKSSLKWTKNKFADELSVGESGYWSPGIEFKFIESLDATPLKWLLLDGQLDLYSGTATDQFTSDILFIVKKNLKVYKDPAGSHTQSDGIIEEGSVVRFINLKCEEYSGIGNRISSIISNTLGRKTKQCTPWFELLVEQIPTHKKP